MKNYLILQRVLLKNDLMGLNPFAQSGEEKASAGKLVMRRIGVILLLLFAAGSVCFLEYELYQLFREMGMREMALGLAVLVGSVGTLLFGLFQGISSLFEGKDAPLLAVLPVTSRQVYAARVTSFIVSQIGTTVVLVLPAFVLYMLDEAAPVGFAIRAILTILLLPLIPVAIISLLATLLMRVSAFSRHRDTIVMILSFGFAIAYALFVTRLNSSADNQVNTIATMLTKDGLLNKMLGFYPPAQWAVSGLRGDWLQLLLLAAVSLAAPVLVVLLLGGSYLSAALGSGERSTRRHSRQQALSWGGSSQLMSLHVLEWRETLRTPAWLYNGLAGVIMFPLMMGVGFYSGFSAASTREGENLIKMVQSLAQTPEFAGYVIVIIAAIAAMGSMVNPLVATAYSREGQNYPFALSLPVKPLTRVWAKLLVGLEINAVCALMITVVMAVIFGVPALLAAVGFLLAQLVGFAISAISLVMDLRHPRLSWANETAAIKTNFNQVISMVLWVILMGLCVVPVVLLWERGGTAVLLSVCGVIALACAVSGVLLWRVGRKASAQN